jgi:hypothetical protein
VRVGCHCSAPARTQSDTACCVLTGSRPRPGSRPCARCGSTASNTRCAGATARRRCGQADSRRARAYVMHHMEPRSSVLARCAQVHETSRLLAQNEYLRRTLKDAQRSSGPMTNDSEYWRRVLPVGRPHNESSQGGPGWAAAEKRFELSREAVDRGTCFHSFACGRRQWLEEKARNRLLEDAMSNNAVYEIEVKTGKMKVGAAPQLPVGSRRGRKAHAHPCCGLVHGGLWDRPIVQTGHHVHQGSDLQALVTHKAHALGAWPPARSSFARRLLACSHAR